MRGYQPRYTALQRQVEQLRPYLNAQGLQNVEDSQDAIKAKWDNVNCSAAERQSVLSGALQHRKDFHGRLQDFEKWVKKMQRKLDSGSEIYTDEVTDTENKLKVSKV